MSMEPNRKRTKSRIFVQHWKWCGQSWPVKNMHQADAKSGKAAFLRGEIFCGCGDVVHQQFWDTMPEADWPDGSPVWTATIAGTVDPLREKDIARVFLQVKVWNAGKAAGTWSKNFRNRGHKAGRNRPGGLPVHGHETDARENHAQTVMLTSANAT